VLAATVDALANAVCRVEPAVPFSYPSIDGGTTLPRNAQLLFVTAGGWSPSIVRWPDMGYSLSLTDTNFDRFRFDVGARLTVGEHEVTLDLNSRDFVFAGPEEISLRFTVSDELAPPPDETGTAVITRVSRVRHRDGASVVEDAAWANAAWADPADCSTMVALQESCFGRSQPARAGEYLLELEAEGPVLGFAIDDKYFLPARCRSAFVPEAPRGDGYSTLPHSIRVVTETGVGSASEYAGEVEDVIHPDPDPYVDPDRPRPPVCSTSAAGGHTGHTGLLGTALLLAVSRARGTSRPRPGSARARDS
jgi:hypothetical protein